MKFKPGLSANFVSRYVQISQRAFRYFRNRYEAKAGKPIVAFRKRIIRAAEAYKVNKASYLKKGSKIAQSGKEDHLFDLMFEIKLNENYEDNFHYRDVEWANKDAQDRADFRKQLRQLQKSRSVSTSLVQKDKSMSRNEGKSSLATKKNSNKFYLGQKKK